ncbi:hypothetical protein ABK040_008889 [Willaertia magna]
MEKLKDILNHYPDATEISLADCGLISLDEMMEDLTKLINLKVLRLSNNQLTKLPSDMSGLRKLEYLDISNNPFQGLTSIMSALCSLPFLRHLYITLPEQDEDELIINLANLQSLNGTPLTDIPDNDEISPIKVKHPQQISKSNIGFEINENDLDVSKKLYDAVSLYLGHKNGFTEFSYDIIHMLKQNVQHENNPTNFQNEVMNGRRILFDKSFDEVVHHVGNYDRKLASVLTIVKNSYSGLLEDYYTFSSRSVEEYNKRLRVMQKDLDNADKEIGQLLEAAEALQQSAQDSEMAKRKVVQELEKEKDKYLEEIGYLKTELEKYKNRLKQFQMNRQKLSTQVSLSPSKILKQNTATASSPSVSKTSQVSSPRGNTKALSLRQLKEIIEEIYISKQKFDEKCAETKLPKETLEQHLYTYLNQKYGLKNLILDWASAIIQGVKRYSREDNDVAVFGKILRNEIDEEFRIVQKQLKDTVYELLRIFLRGKYAKKVDSEIQTMINQRVNGELHEEEWVDIVKYMYNKEDSVNVIIKVQEAIQLLQIKQSKGTSRAGDSPTKLTNNKIPYKLFVKVLLTYQLQGHEKFLKKFVRIFRKIDADGNGVLNEIEFNQLLYAINNNRTEEEIQNWLQYVDPYNNQHITFSECVSILSSDLIKLVDDNNVSGETENECETDETIDSTLEVDQVEM